MLPNKKNLWSTPTAFDAHNIKGERKKSSGGQIEPLQQQVRMWPTPTVDNNEHKNMKVDEKGRRVATKEGGTTHSLNLADTVRMWPTPRAGDPEGGVAKNVELKDGSFSRTNKKGVRWGVKLKDAVSHVEKQKNMFPTPSSRDWKGGHGTIVNEDGKYYRVSNTTGTKWGARLDAQIEKMESEKQEMLPTPRAALGMTFKMTEGMANLRHKKYLETEVAYDHIKVKKNSPGGSLNPDWVEWLMGYGQGYSDPDNKDSFTLGSHQGFPTEPDTARVTTENQYRKDRLKALGNSIVPQIAYHIGNAILEQEKI